MKFFAVSFFVFILSNIALLAPWLGLKKSKTFEFNCLFSWFNQMVRSLVAIYWIEKRQKNCDSNCSQIVLVSGTVYSQHFFWNNCSKQHRSISLAGVFLITLCKVHSSVLDIFGPLGNFFLGFFFCAVSGGGSTKPTLGRGLFSVPPAALEAKLFW